MSHILAEWPMNRENLEEPMATGQYQQLACLYMPIEIFRAGAQTFKDFKSRTEDERKMASAWRAYVSVFNALAEKARWLFGAKVTLKLEQVMHKDLSKQETLGYMWWLLYTPPPPVPVDKDDPNSEYVAVDKETLDWIAYRDVIGHYQNTVVAPKNSSQYGEKISTAKILSGNAFSRISDAWRKIPSYETWSDFVSLVVGWDHVKLGTGTQPDLAVTRFDFSPEAAFAMHQDDVCWAQSIARMVPKTGGSHGGYLPDNFREKPTFCVTWADSRRVYNVPEDLISTSQLSVMMMPHCQKVRSETACQLRILLPRLVSACAAELTGDPNRVEEDTVMVIVDTDAEEIERLRSEVLVKTKRCNSKRQRLAQISGAHKLMSNNGSAGLVEGITERKMTATPYHPIAGATSDVRNKVVKHIAPYDTLAARKISIIARNAALSSYEMQSLYSPLMSDAMRTILDAIDRDDLLNITDDVRKYFRRPKDLTNHCNGLSPLASFLRKFLVGMENVKHINHLHRYCLMAEICAMDSPRFALDLHLHLLLMSHKGGIGKSLIWAIMKYLMIEGTVLTPTYRTGAASTGADENGNYNFGSDCVVNMDELASSSMKPRPGEANDIVARLKYELSNGCIEVSSVKFDDDGRRITTTEFIVRSLVYMASSNSLEVEIAMGRRWWLPVLPEEPPGERHAADTMNQAALDPKEIQIVDKVMQRVYHFKHAVIAHAEKMIQSGILPEPSDDICGILNLALTQRLRDNQFYVEPNITVFQRLRIIARQQCIWRAVVDAFCIGKSVV